MAGSIAGTVLAEADPPNDNWRRCNGTYILNQYFTDYWQRVGFSHGGGWIGGMRLPDVAGSIICVRDDAAYPPDPPPEIPDPPVDDAGRTKFGAGMWEP